MSSVALGFEVYSSLARFELGSSVLKCFVNDVTREPTEIYKTLIIFLPRVLSLLILLLSLEDALLAYLAIFIYYNESYLKLGS
jgi:hypothetical protein